MVLMDWPDAGEDRTRKGCIDHTACEADDPKMAHYGDAVLRTACQAAELAASTRF